MEGNVNFENLADKISQEIDAERETLVTLCGNFVAAESMSPPGRTTEVAPLVCDYLEANGIKTEKFDQDGEAPNIVGQVRGHGAGKHVVFNAHMDTMRPGDESAWTVPILALTRKQGRLYGLGMGNMKGALAAMCVATAVLKRHERAFGGLLSMTAVCDEVMFGERGAVYLLKQRPDLQGDYLISGEGPGFMGLANAEKGLLWLDIEARSYGGHSSRALNGQTSVMKLARVLNELDTINDMYATIPTELNGISGGENNSGMRVSFNAGTIGGGGVRSLVATTTCAEIDVRLPPGVTVAEIEKKARDVAAKYADVQIFNVKSWDASWTGLDTELVKTMADVVGAVRGKPAEFVVRLPGSDARRWRDLGVPAVCYGPQPLLSAGVDDYAEEQDVVDCAKVYARAALRLLRPPHAR